MKGILEYKNKRDIRWEKRYRKYSIIKIIILFKIFDIFEISINYIYIWE